MLSRPPTSQVAIATIAIAIALTTHAHAQSPKLKMTTPIPDSIMAPASVDTPIGTLEYFDGVPKSQTVDAVYDYLDQSRAVEAFMNCLPAVSLNAIREAQHSAGAKEPWLNKTWRPSDLEPVK